MTHQHKAGSLKQTNKAFKSKHSTKGSIKKKAGGKIESKHQATKQMIREKKDQRKNQTKQKINTRRQQNLAKTRKFGEAPPRIVAVVPLGVDEAVLQFHERFHKEAVKSTDENMDQEYQKVFYCAKWKQRINLLVNNPQNSNIDSLLLNTQAADIILFTIPSTSISTDGFEILRVIAAQGFPSVIAVVNFPKETNSDFPQKKDFERMLALEFGEKTVKVYDMNKLDEILRGVCQIGLTEAPVARNLARPYLFADSAPRIVQHDTQHGRVVEIEGYLRGGALNANQLMHVPGFGDFQVLSVSSVLDPHSSKPHSHPSHSSMLTDPPAPLVSEETTRESLQSENDPDPMDGDQTIFSDDEDTTEKKQLRKVPKGTSSYQAAWIYEEGDEDASNDPLPLLLHHNHSPHGHHDDDDDEMGENDDDDRVSVAPDDLEEDDEEEEYEYIDVNDKGQQLKKLEQEDIDFPDEVETQPQIPAREQFAKYRGLKSFRTSPWDNRENLPRDYAKIYQFKSFRQTQNRVLAHHDGIADGGYVKVVLLDVDEQLLKYYEENHSLLLVALFPYERKMTVLHFTVKRVNSYTLPIASKDELVFYCGFRKLVCRPIYSENTTSCDKHKYERFLLPTTTSVASIYGPAMFIPCPLLVFKRVAPGEVLPEGMVAVNGYVLAATGTLHSVNTDRMIIKKITLTGEPFRIFKRRSVIRKMFYSPEDIKWFKPVELRTKLGRTGIILDSIGTHGYMRCLFDAQLQQNDVVTMNLYKRVFPKWKAEYSLVAPSSHGI